MKPTDKIADKMKIVPLAVLFFAATTIAVPTPENTCAVDEATALKLMHDFESIAPDGALQERQGLPTQAACYTACDQGVDALVRFCRFIPGPLKAGCAVVGSFLDTPFGQRLCRNFCNQFQ